MGNFPQRFSLPKRLAASALAPEVAGLKASTMAYGAGPLRFTLGATGGGGGGQLSWETSRGGSGTKARILERGGRRELGRERPPRVRSWTSIDQVPAEMRAFAPMSIHIRAICGRFRPTFGRPTWIPGSLSRPPFVSLSRKRQGRSSIHNTRSGRLRPTTLNAGRGRSKIALTWSKFGKKMAQICLNQHNQTLPARLGPISTRFGRSQPDLGRARSKLWSRLTGAGPSLVKYGQARSKL